MDLGLGKTRTVLEFIKSRGKKVLVIAPLRVAISTWPSEISKWTPHLSYVVLHGKGREEKLKSNADVYIINYEGLKWLMTVVHRGMFAGGTLVLDEATKVKSHSSKVFKFVKSLRPVFANVYCLSATPAPNGLHDLWSQYFLLDYGRSLGSTFYKFFNKYFRQLESRRIVPLPEAKLEIPAKVAKLTFRLDARDYLSLPDQIENDIIVDLPRPLMDKYKTLENDFVYELSNGGIINATTAATLSMKLRQFCQGGLISDTGVSMVHTLKLEALQQLVEELNDEPVLIAFQFKFEAEELKKTYPGIPLIYGPTSAKASEAYIDQWNKRQLPLIACHPASIAHGVNLQFGGHNIIWLALTWSCEHYLQFNGRLRRQGQSCPVVVNRILIRGTIEHRISSVLKGKQVTQENLLDVLRACM